MPSRRPFPLLLIWLNWVAANGASWGAIGTLIDIGTNWLQLPTVYQELIVGFFFFSGTGGILFWAFAQQIVLQGAEIRANDWVATTFGGMVLAALGTIVGAVVLGVIVMILSSRLAGLAFALSMPFAFGAILGAVQSKNSHHAPFRRWLWIVASGAGTAFALAAPMALTRPSASVALTTAGGAYGIITGFALVWMLLHPSPPPHPRLHLNCDDD